ncbi:MAG TPA: hypothetical protein VFN35_03545 [Ktedonobacteraceae bacterium]|nr:hypothetical protein [Ktedonobacteraceae bacterium]
MGKLRGLLLIIVLFVALAGLVSSAGSSLRVNTPSVLHTTILTPVGAESSHFRLAAICPGGGPDDC